MQSSRFFVQYVQLKRDQQEDAVEPTERVFVPSKSTFPEIARGKVGLGHELAQKLAQIMHVRFLGIRLACSYFATSVISCGLSIVSQLSLQYLQVEYRF